MSDKNPFEHWKLPEVAAENDDLNREYFEKGEMDQYPYFSKLVEAMQKILKLDPIGRPVSCLDVGCGAGWQIRYLESKMPGVFDFSGMDISPHMCERARKNCPGVEFHVADLMEFAPGRKWDIVMACGSMEHFEDWPGFLQRLGDLSRSWVLIHKAFFTEGKTSKEERTIYHGLTEIRMTIKWQDFTLGAKDAGLHIVDSYDWSGYISGVILEKGHA
jgi:SAM-dependent methyltransferase